MFLNRHQRAGQSLIEILVALAVGAILIVGGLAIVTPIFKGGTTADRDETAIALASAMMDNARALSESNWNALYLLNKGTSSLYYFVPGTSLTVATGTEAVAGDGVTSGLVGEWKLDEGNGGTAYDYSGNSNALTWNGTQAGSSGYYGTGKIGSYAGYFDGSTNYLYESTFSTSLDALSISFWVQTTSTAATTVLTLNRTPTNITDELVLQINANGTVTFWDYTGSAYGFVNTQSSTKTVNDGKWHLVTWVKSGTQGAYYIDGVLDQQPTAASDIPYGTTVLAIGKDYRNNNEFVAGSLNDVRIYNRALSAAEVKAIYNSVVYTRSFYISNVNRNGSGNITTGAGTNDPSTQEITVDYSWPQSGTRTLSTYVTRNANNVFWQTDWSGGSGINGPFTTSTNGFATSSNVDTATTTGAIRITGL